MHLAFSPTLWYALVGSLLGVTFWQCTKENTTSCPGEIMIGLVEPGVTQHLLDPAILLTSRYDTLYYEIDVNSDGNSDLIFKAFAGYFFGGMALSQSRISVQTNNTMTQVLTDSLHYVRKVEQNVLLTLESDWEQGDLVLVTARDPCCPPIGDRGYVGPWRTFEIGYIGIRQGECLGWIKVKVSFGAAIHIYEHALQNTN